MVIHISLIGRNPEHLRDGLKEIIPSEKLYLLHSPNTKLEKFTDIAKKTKKEIEKSFCETILVKIDAFDMMSVWNAIDKIVSNEMENDTLLSPRDFAINVTGGTNLMSSAATVAATLTGCRAYYVRHRKMEPGRKHYAEELPIPPINIIRRLSSSHQKILQVLAKGEFEWKGERRKGVMRNKVLQKKLNLRASTLNSAIKELKKKGYVDTETGVPILREKQSSIDNKPVMIEEVLENEMLVKISQLGLIRAKKASMH